MVLLFFFFFFFFFFFLTSLALSYQQPFFFTFTASNALEKCNIWLTDHEIVLKNARIAIFYCLHNLKNFFTCANDASKFHFTNPIGIHSNFPVSFELFVRSAPVIILFTVAPVLYLL